MVKHSNFMKIPKTDAFVIILVLITASRITLPWR